ncbi:hypothetical protein [Leucobacter sp. G161]|uniref:hypothetical protein n=1 Tax=Leucobacter sp. G161 TaxID=663704 RepID=UPI00073CBDAA|nr:hypothetical protein [Leucobacter sp. G161]KUF05640.1 hypothetical protein AUL38_03960 [Leucobacter sp. G161]
MTQNCSRRGRSRLALAAGGLLSIAALTTTAFFTDFVDLEAQVDGTRNTFDIVVAGATDPHWQPTADDWVQADEEAFIIDLGESTELPPGATKHVKIAVKNVSPDLSADLTLRLADPDPQGDAVNPETGRFLELFDKLEFELSEQGEPLLAVSGGAPADERQFSWREPLEPDRVREIIVAITLPAETDDRWQQASTQIQFGFEAVNSHAAP